MKELWFHTCAIADKKLWFISTDNVLVAMELATGEVKAAEIRGYTKSPLNTVAENIISHKDNLFWIEQDGKRMVKYNIKSNEVDFYTMPALKFANWCCVSSIFAYDNKIYFIPRIIEKIVVFDISKEEFSFLLDLRNAVHIDEYMKPEDLFVDAVKINNEVLIFEKKGEYVIVYNLSDNTAYTRKVFDTATDINKAVLHDGKAWILSEQSKLYVWDFESEVIECIWENRDNESVFSDFAITNSKVFLFPSTSKEIMIYDRKNDRTVIYQEYPEDFCWDDTVKWYKYIRSFYYNGCIWYANRAANYCVRVDEKKEDLQWYQVKFKEEKEEIKYVSKCNLSLWKEQVGDLKIFCKSLLESIHNDCTTTNYGEEIWRMLNDKRI